MKYEELRERVEAAYESGEPVEALAGQYGVPEHAIENILEHVRLAERKEVALRLRRDEGATYDAIAQETGLSTRTLYRLFAKEGLVDHGGRAERLTPEAREEIRYRRFAGEPVPDIAQEFGVSESHVYRLTQDVVGPSAQPQLSQSARDQIAHHFLVDRIPVVVLAEKFGVSETTVYAHRFKDPILHAEWHRVHGVQWEKVRLWCKFRDADSSVAEYQKVWVECHRLGRTYAQIAEAYGWTEAKVRMVCTCATESAYRALWEVMV